jgi:hypothetical protein
VRLRLGLLTEIYDNVQWHRSLELFGGMPLSRNKDGGLIRGLLTLGKNVHAETFVGAEGVSWFLEKLNEEFSNNVDNAAGAAGISSISRGQVVMLMDKFLKAGVFEAVGEGQQLQQFKDDKGIYRWVLS